MVIPPTKVKLALSESVLESLDLLNTALVGKELQHFFKFKVT